MLKNINDRVSCSLATTFLVICCNGALAAQPSAGDKQFMHDTAIAGMTEVKLGEVAEKNSSNKEVLEFAKTMVKDHSSANAALKDVATKESVDMPANLDGKHQEVLDRLSKAKGDGFDRDYMNQMLQDHKKVVASLEKEQKVASGPLKDWCDKTLPTVKGHLKMAEDWSKNTAK